MIQISKQYSIFKYRKRVIYIMLNKKLDLKLIFTQIFCFYRKRVIFS